MGSCISKCKPKKPQQLEEGQDQDHHQQFGHNNVEDKIMIITQTPKATTQTLFPNNPKIASHMKTPSSPSHSISSSSVSSFITCTTSKATVSSSSSTSSSTSSALSGKDKPSFSDEFLRSCYNENPHVVRINSLKETATPKKTFPQKRVRSNSPINNTNNLTRQKSFRRDNYYYHKSSTLRSPSPSRRFGNNGEKFPIGPYNHINSRACSTPNNSNSSRFAKPCLRSSNRSREQRNVHRISSKIDEISVAKALACHEIDNILMEDIDNPLISMDCFIFI